MCPRPEYGVNAEQVILETLMLLLVGFICGLGGFIQKGGVMSTETPFKEKKLTRFEKFQNIFNVPYELSVCMGATFFLFPAITMNRNEILSVDWLWIHIGIYSC